MNNSNSSMQLDNYFVATLDILGIKNAIYNSTDDCLKVMSRNFLKAMANGRELLKEEFLNLLTDDDVRTKFLKLYNETNVWVFSDTIVMTLNLDKLYENFDSDGIQVAISLFFNQVVMMFYNLFCMGFPSRCCIDIGRLEIQNNFVFGAAYVNALTICEALDFSGIVISDAAANRLKSVPNDLIGDVKKCKISVPLSKSLHGEKEMQIWCLDWISHKDKTLRIAIEKDRQWIWDMFSQHNKQITNSVERKIKNTERVLRQIAALTTITTN
jgi:hypothetical protein